jgi:hypothetical protein
MMTSAVFTIENSSSNLLRQTRNLRPVSRKRTLNNSVDEGAARNTSTPIKLHFAVESIICTPASYSGFPRFELRPGKPPVLTENVTGIPLFFQTSVGVC